MGRKVRATAPPFPHGKEATGPLFHGPPVYKHTPGRGVGAVEIRTEL